MTGEHNNPHWNDEQWGQWLSADAKDRSAEMSEHLAQCSACLAEAERLNSLLHEFRTGAVQAAVQEAPFWSRQRVMISSRIESAERKFTLRIAYTFALAAAMVIIAFNLPEKPVPAKPAAIVSDKNDEAMLLDIQNDIYQDVPAAFAPATKVQAERTKLLKARKSQSEKENQ